MKTISRILVGFGVLMGSMGFVANAQGLAPAPGQKGGQSHSSAVRVPPPPPRPEQNKNMGKAPMPQNNRNNGRRAEMQRHNCKECLNLFDFFGIIFGCKAHNHLYH